MIKVLFITHECSQTGAPLQLLQIIKNLKQNYNIQPTIILRNPGPLKKEFLKFGSCIEYIPKVFYIENKNVFLQLITKVLLKLYWCFLNLYIRILRIDIVYSNTLVNASVLKRLKLNRKKVIIHAHELEKTIEHYGGVESVKFQNSIASHFICVSDDVENLLNTKYQISKDKTSVVYNYIDDKFTKQYDKGKLRSILNITNKSIIIGNSGAVTKQKGVFDFIKLANEIIRSNYLIEIHFVWLGEICVSIESNIPDQLKPYIHFTGFIKNPEKYYPDFDAFITVSHEESVGMAAIEAGLQGVPFFCPTRLTFLSRLISKYDYELDNMNQVHNVAKILFHLNDNITLKKNGVKLRETLLAMFNSKETTSKIFKILLN